jgi:hypothetical protein
MTEIPNREWYAKLSQERHVAFHCPFATIEACPRFYQSLSLLGEAGSTKISEAEDERLLKHWKSSDLWPRTDEQATGLFGGAPGNPSMYCNFCPEVTFERFGYFATTLAKYGDEIDSGFAHERLAKNGTPPGHPNWSWSSCTSQHFTDCPIYSVLSHRTTVPQPQESEPWWRKHLAEIIVAVIVAVATAIISKMFA